MSFVSNESSCFPDTESMGSSSWAGVAGRLEPGAALLIHARTDESREVLLKAEQLRSSPAQARTIIVKLVDEWRTSDCLRPGERSRCVVSHVMNQLQRPESIEPIVKTTQPRQRGRRLRAECGPDIKGTLRFQKVLHHGVHLPWQLWP